MLDSRDMKELEKLKDLFMDEITTITKKGTLTPADGEAAKIALEALNLYNCICCESEDPQKEMSMLRRGASMMIDPYGNHVPYDGYSERRGRDSMGRYTSRRHGETIDGMISKLEGMKRELENE